MNHPYIEVTGRVLTFSKDTIARNPGLPEIFGAGGGAEKELRSLPVRRDSGNTSQVSDGQVATCNNPSQQPSNARPARPSRIQQHSNPKLNQLEREALEWLKGDYQEDYYLRPHAMRLELANGCLYTPDIIGQPTPHNQYECTIRAWEVKGKHAWDDSIVKLKVAAREWPSIRFTLIWREGKHGPWLEQEVLP
jgi:hypothetical protein